MESVGSQVRVGQVTSAVSGSQQLAADTALPLENMNLASRISGCGDGRHQTGRTST